MLTLDQVSDPYVLRVLINANNIERILLAPSRAQADDILERLPHGGTAWTADLYNVVRYKYATIGTHPCFLDLIVELTAMAVDVLFR